MNAAAYRPVAAVSALVLALLAPVAVADEVERLSFVSEPGDAVGLGQSMTLSPLLDSGSESSVWMSGRGSDGDYILYMQTPGDGPMQPGVYENAHGGDVEYDPARPRLEFQHESRRCTAVGGRFGITDVKIEQSGYIERFRATFEQRCEGSNATLWGQVDIVKPALDPVTTFDIEIQPVVELVRSTWRPGYEDIFGHFVATCNNRTGGTFEATLVQRGTRGTVTRATTSDRMGCSPEGSRETAMFPTEGFRPGRATLTVDAFVVDPVLGEEGPYISTVVTREVLLRPKRPERRARAAGR